MSTETVREYLKEYNVEDRIKELEESSATVELAAKALGCKEARIAKTLSFKKENKCILIVTSGDAKVDNAKYKEKFKVKASMLNPEQVIEFTGHTIGGVCPFAVKETVEVYTDVSLKRFQTVFLAAGASNSTIELNCEETFQISKAIEWVDVCKNWAV